MAMTIRKKTAVKLGRADRRHRYTAMVSEVEATYDVPPRGRCIACVWGRALTRGRRVCVLMRKLVHDFGSCGESVDDPARMAELRSEDSMELTPVGSRPEGVPVCWGDFDVYDRKDVVCQVCKWRATCSDSLGL